MNIYDLDVKLTFLLESAIREYAEFAENELEQLYSYLNHDSKLTIEDIKSIVNDNHLEWPRGKTKEGKSSLLTALVRMYGLMHGELPDGLNPSPAWYERNSSNMINFLDNKGYDVASNLELVKIDAEEKQAQKMKRKTRDEAKQIMADHWMKVKHMFPKHAKEKMIASRDEIISRIENGEEVEQVFNSLI